MRVVCDGVQTAPTVKVEQRGNIPMILDGAGDRIRSCIMYG